MKRLIYISAVVFGLLACKPNASEKTEGSAVDSVGLEKEQVLFPEAAKNMTIYEVNIRQHTEEGTLNAFAEDLPRIKALGTEILWLMPVQPIGEKNRKGVLGSYYSIKDYREINPEFGTLEDYKNLVQKAHELGLYVIMDWVPNHTAWDHPWIIEHPEYYAKNDEGEITYEADWTDIALLDHSNEELRKAMKEEMAFWVQEADIDGFRVDHAAHEIPMLLWEEIIPSLNEIKSLFWLAEWDDPKLHPLFHASYNWAFFHLSNEVAKGEKSSDVLVDDYAADQGQFGAEPFRLNMITNHDENAWNGTVFERYGEGNQAFAVFMYTVGGIPMVYSGQEAGMDKRLKFFEKDQIDWSDPKGFTAFYTSLIKLRKDNPALWSGVYGGETTFVEDNNENVVVYTRVKEGNEVTVVLNLSGEAQEVAVSGFDGGESFEYFSGENFTKADNIALSPFQYLVLISNK